MDGCMDIEKEVEKNTVWIEKEMDREIDRCQPIYSMTNK